MKGYNYFSILSNGSFLKARSSEFKNFADLLSEDREGKNKENVEFKYFDNRASSMGNHVGNREGLCRGQQVFRSLVQQ